MALLAQALPRTVHIRQAIGHTRGAVFCVNRDCPDFEETGFFAEYVEGVYVCPRCGSPLEATPPDVPDDLEDADEESPELRLEPVFESWDPAEVPVVKGLLEAADIPCLTEGAERFNALSGGRSPFRFNPRAGSVVFLVPEELAEEARGLLAELEDAE